MAINFPSTVGQPTDGSFTHTHNGVTWIWSGTSWDVSIPPSTEISENPPSDPSHGDLWWNSDEGVLKVYYQDSDSAQWVDAAGNGPGGNPTITTQDISNWNQAYTDVSNLQTQVNSLNEFTMGQFAAVTSSQYYSQDKKEGIKFSSIDSQNVGTYYIKLVNDQGLSSSEDNDCFIFCPSLESPSKIKFFCHNYDVVNSNVTITPRLNKIDSQNSISFSSSDSAGSTKTLEIDNYNVGSLVSVKVEISGQNLNSDIKIGIITEQDTLSSGFGSNIIYLPPIESFDDSAYPYNPASMNYYYDGNAWIRPDSAGENTANDAGASSDKGIHVISDISPGGATNIKIALISDSAFTAKSVQQGYVRYVDAFYLYDQDNTAINLTLQYGPHSSAILNPTDNDQSWDAYTQTPLTGMAGFANLSENRNFGITFSEIDGRKNCKLYPVLIIDSVSNLNEHNLFSEMNTINNSGSYHISENGIWQQSYDPATNDFIFQTDKYVKLSCDVNTELQADSMSVIVRNGTSQISTGNQSISQTGTVPQGTFLEGEYFKVSAGDRVNLELNTVNLVGTSDLQIGLSCISGIGRGVWHSHLGSSVGGESVSTSNMIITEDGELSRVSVYVHSAPQKSVRLEIFKNQTPTGQYIIINPTDSQSKDISTNESFNSGDLLSIVSSTEEFDTDAITIAMDVSLSITYTVT
tara:strand:- start:10686 stop:12758 length:2073 start_codon:yes stop_codon:yes gene_type:complete